jgi:hypothetical protein
MHRISKEPTINNPTILKRTTSCPSIWDIVITVSDLRYEFESTPA